MTTVLRNDKPIRAATLDRRPEPVTVSAPVLPAMRVTCLTISHRTATAETRQRFALSEAARREFSARFRATCPGAELLILSTCNRVEVYVAHDCPHSSASPANLAQTPADQAVAAIWGDLLDLAPAEFARVESLDGTAAAMHLCHVAAGLESIVLGETQILSQLKDAFTFANECETIGPALHGITHLAFKVGRRARRETAIAAGRVSVASVGVDMARKILAGTLAGKTALIVGAGKIGQLTMKHLLDAGISRVIVANRTAARAAELAADAHAVGVAVEIVDLFAVPARLAEADIIATAVSAPTADGAPILPLSCLTALQHRSASTADSRPVVILDFGVPANIDRCVSEWPGVTRLGVDDLARETSASRAMRESAVPDVKAIVAAEWREFTDPSGALGRHVIDALFRRFSDVTRCEVAVQMRHGMPTDPAQLDAFAQRLVRKLLAPVAQRYRKRSADAASSLDELKFLVDMFGLQPEPETEVEPEMAAEFPAADDFSEFAPEAE